MSDFLQARTFDGALWVSASDAMALRSRLAKAEALLRLSQKSCGRELAESISAYFAADSATSREDDGHD